MPRLLPVALLPALLLAACLPSSQRSNTHAVTPADSLSMRLAAEAPVDTLRLLWAAGGPGSFELPTSLVWLPDSAGGRLVVADTKRGSLRVLAATGDSLADWQPEGLAYPYTAGTRGDTVVVFNRGAQRLDFVVEGRGVRRVPLPDAFSAVLATDRLLWAKRSEEGHTYLARLDEAGREAARYRLPAPYWRHIGFLRPWGDSLVSLSGYRPVVDLLPPGAAAGATPDTLALVGVDSPELVRSYKFMLDEVDDPPLLTSTAAALGGRLFVVNLRADHLRIDVYARADGGLRLQRVLVHPAVAADAFPVDVAVREDGGTVRFALVLQNPGGLFRQPFGRVVMLAWDQAGDQGT